MFPTLNYFFKYFFGWDWGMNFPPTFGFFVAMGFIAASTVLGKELQRKEALGLLKGTKKKIIVGEPASTSDFTMYGIIGFIIGYKILAIFLGDPTFKIAPQDFILSTKGNFIGGIIGSAIGIAYIYFTKKKTALEKPKEEEITVSPKQHVGNITFAALIGGILGAKIFHQIEYFDQFLQDPIGSLVSTSGLTFYGGLIGGFIAVLIYARKQKFPFMHIADAVAPGLILAYAIGRIGCMTSGDGDWGIINSAYRISDDRKYSIVAEAQIQQDLNAPLYIGDTVNTVTIKDTYSSGGQPVDFTYFPKPKVLGFLPDWFFAFDFPHNVNNEGVAISKCRGEFCSKLPIPVFPTAMYETIMGLFIFLILWLIRKRIHTIGLMFFIYLILNGIERFLIEKIRVNVHFDFLGMSMSQAEVIALILILIGLVGVIFSGKIKNVLVKM